MQMYCEVNKHAEVVVCDRTQLVMAWERYFLSANTTQSCTHCYPLLLQVSIYASIN